MEPMEKQVATIKDALKELDARCGEISDQQAAIEVDVCDAFSKIQKVLDARKTNLIGQLQQITRSKLKGLATQRDQIETTLAQLSSCLHFMKESLESANRAEVLMMKVSTVNQATELTAAFQPETLKPNTKADVIFSAPADLTSAYEKFGLVSSLELPDPSKCSAVPQEEASVGEPSSVCFKAVNCDDQPCEKLVSLECELVSEITGTRAKGKVDRRGQSEYEISYQPVIKGRHQLHIKVGGQHIKQSPFSVVAKLPIKMLSTPILTMKANRPWGVAYNQRGEAVVTEWGGHCVSVFSPSGKKVRSFGTLGYAVGMLKHPRGVAVDSVGNIVVVDCSNNSIQKFTAQGQFLAAVGAKGSNQLQFDNPRDVAFNAINDKLYITDKNHRVQVLNSDLSFSSCFGTKGTGKGQFDEPWGVACDSTGKVYVADGRNGRIQIFTEKGKFLKAFWKCDNSLLTWHVLKWPVGVALDGEGRVYVSDRINCCIFVFTSEGQFVTSFGNFNYLGGLAVDNTGVLCVCDINNNNIQLY